MEEIRVNDEVMELVEEVELENAGNSILKKIGVGAAIVGAGYLVYRFGKKVVVPAIKRAKAKKAEKALADEYVNLTEDEFEIDEK